MGSEDPACAQQHHKQPSGVNAVARALFETPFSDRKGPGSGARWHDAKVEEAPTFRAEDPTCARRHPTQEHQALKGHTRP